MDVRVYHAWYSPISALPQIHRVTVDGTLVLKAVDRGVARIEASLLWRVWTDRRAKPSLFCSPYHSSGNNNENHLAPSL